MDGGGVQQSERDMWQVGGSPAQLQFGGGFLGVKSPRRPTLLVPVAGGSRGLRWIGGHQPDNPQAQSAVEEDLPGMEGPGGLEE